MKRNYLVTATWNNQVENFSTHESEEDAREDFLCCVWGLLARAPTDHELEKGYASGLSPIVDALVTIQGLTLGNNGVIFGGVLAGAAAPFDAN